MGGERGMRVVPGVMAAVLLGGILAGASAAGAALSYPDAVAVNGTSLVFADQDTSRIRQVTG